MLKLAIGCCLLLSFPTYGQVQDKASVISVVDELFEGMRQGDSARVHRVFATPAQLHTITQEGALSETSLARFLAAIGTPHDEVWDERVSSYEVQIDGPLASVWTPYTFYRDTTLSHCGVNAFQLIRRPEGWKILQITDTRRQEGCQH